MEAYQKTQLLDAIEPMNFEKDQNIITQGDAGNSMYFIYSGEAAAFKDGVKV